MNNPLEEYRKTRDEWEDYIYQHIFDRIDRRLLVLRFLDGMTLQEISEEINLSIEQTKRRVNRAKMRLICTIDDTLKP